MTITRRRSRRRIPALLAAFALAVSLAALTAGPAQAERENFVGMAATPDGGGYWLTASDGTIDAFGDAGFFGSAHDAVTQKSLGGVVGIARTPDGRGYWLATSGNSGGATVFTFGDAGFFGQPLSLGFGQVVGITATPDGRGYWLAENNGTIKTFGDAGFFGDGRS